MESSPDGLTQAEAQKRLTQYGPNEIAEEKKNIFLKFLGYFWGPIPWMIEIAVILSGVVGHWPDFFIILLLLVANAVIGFWEERETGDALAIAKETAKKLNMGANILDATSLGDSKRQETSAVAESIEKADGFAQVFPEHKFHIVDVLQKRGHIVGMTGDGVNDAPALKKADCGIAVSDATDAARAAAAIVLTTPGLSVIIDAIKESRRIFQRMNSYAIYRIAHFGCCCS